jgi:outer membrane protein assembly factor BamB
MTLLKPSFVFLLLLLLLTGCTKTDVINDPLVDPQPTTPAAGSKPNGILYINSVGQFTKINTVDSSVNWTSSTINLFGSAGCPMTFDSATFYHGNHSGLTAYSTQTGLRKWSFSWYASSDGISFREPAIKDSLLFVATPTSIWYPSFLYCLNKRTGAITWNKEIDKGYVDNPFNTTPMVIEDKVIVLTRDADNHKRLTAFKTGDGTQLWTTEINDSLSFRLKFVDGNIYSTSNRSVFCYNATDGALNWQTDLQQGASYMESSFFEKGKLILVNVLGKDYTIVLMNTANGAVISKYTLAVPTEMADAGNAPLACNYYNNTLFVTTHHNFDTVSIRSYDLSNGAMKWEKRFANYYYSFFKPLLSDKYLVFPINTAYPDGKSIMYFLDFNGKQITGIPFNANYNDGFVYVENGITYKLDNRYVNR